MQILVFKVNTQKVLEFYILTVNIYYLLKNSGYAFKPLSTQHSLPQDVLLKVFLFNKYNFGKV